MNTPIDSQRRFVKTSEGMLFLTPEEISQITFDFTFDCPVYFVQTVEGGVLSICDDLCLWTDADAAQTFIDRNDFAEASILEIESEEQLLSILLSAQDQGCAAVAVDLVRSDQENARVVYITDMIDLVREMMAD
jgi:hypothetical protein